MELWNRLRKYVRKIKGNVTEKDLDSAIRTGICPKCHKGSFKRRSKDMGYNFDSEGRILESTNYECDTCDFFSKKEVDTGVTEKELEEAKNILKKHDLLEVNEEFERRLNEKMCPECGNKEWIIFDKKREELICKYDGSVTPKYHYPSYGDTEDVKEIIKNKDSKEEIKKIVDKKNSKETSYLNFT